MGLAFHPDYTANGYLFISYTGAGGASRLDRFQVDFADPYQADLSSQINLLELAQPFANHNGGCIEFGPDGYLYWGLGDGGDGSDPGCRAQNGQELLGKLLRLDVDTVDATGSYGIPADNPFVGDSNVRDEIAHLGLRNPWRFSFDRQTGNLVIADVGQQLREEIDYAEFTDLGLNFGWKIQEGSLCHSDGNCAATTPECGSGEFTSPLYEYDHDTGCSITGGAIYRGSAIAAWDGRYLYGDYCSANIWTLDPSQANPVPTDHTADLDPPGPLDVTFLTSFGVDWRGEPYVCEQWSGEVFAIVPEGAAGGAPALDAWYERLSISSGGFQGLILDAGPAQAGGLYLVLGSASGTTPGLAVDGLNLPLNFDPYLNATLSNLNQGPYVRTLGFLDAKGRADAQIRIPRGAVSPNAAGTILHHAFAVLDPATGALAFTSQAVPLELIP